VQGHPTRLEQVEHRISELEDKIEIKERLWTYIDQTR
jgi:hypothetical protein